MRGRDKNVSIALGAFMAILAGLGAVGCKRKADAGPKKKVIGFSIFDMQYNFFQEMEKAGKKRCIFFVKGR